MTTISTQMAPAVPSHAQADDHGRAHLTLPTEGGRVELGIRERSPLASSEIDTGILRLRLRWEPGFRPDQSAEVSRPEGNERRFRLMDDDGNSAVLDAPELIEPIKEHGRLLLRVTVPHRDVKDFAAVTGEVIDEQGQAIAGAMSP